MNLQIWDGRCKFRIGRRREPRQDALRTALSFAVGLIVAATTTTSCPAATLRVMTFNVWSAEGTAAGRDKLVQIIQAADADVVGLQEMDNAAGQAVAAQLGMHYASQSGGDIQVLSKFPIVTASSAGLGVQIQYAAQASAWLFNAHLAPYPYQPYDLRDGALAMTEAAVVAAANAARGAQTTAYLNDMRTALASRAPVFFTGDFNEPSHLDWTAAAAAATSRSFDLKVEYPTSKRIVDAGMLDSFRAVRPDEVQDPAYTWTPGAPPPNVELNEVHDRIDVVYHAGVGVTPTGAWVVGPAGGDPFADVAVAGYNADHRAVVVEFEVPDAAPLIADLNGDGFVNTADWALLRSNQFVSLSGLTPMQAYLRGDLNGDLANNYVDFQLFRTAYLAQHGPAAWTALTQEVPEPGAAYAVAVAAIVAGGRRRRSWDVTLPPGPGGRR